MAMTWLYVLGGVLLAAILIIVTYKMSKKMLGLGKKDKLWPHMAKLYNEWRREKRDRPLF